MNLGCDVEDCEALPEPRAFVLLEEDDEGAAVSTEGECEQARCDSEGEIGCLGYSFRLATYASECAVAITFTDGTEAVATLSGTEADECGYLYVRVGSQ